MFVTGVPKSSNSVQFTEFGIPIRNLWHMLLYAWNEYPITSHWSLEDVEDAPTLDALLAAILAKLIQQRLRIGLGRNYVNQNQSIRGIRGRIDFTESLKQRSFEHGQAFCEFQQYSANAPKNQIVRSTLARLVQTGSFGHDRTLANESRHNLRWLARSLDGIDIIELKLDFIRRQQFGRNDGDYRLMLAICELILQRQMPTEATGQHRLPKIDHQALVLYNIYERFIANFYRLHLNGYTLKAQPHLSWHTKQENTYLPIMKPDLIFQRKASGDIIVLDTKFTAKSLTENMWGKQLFESSHLYQMYAYLNTQERLSEFHQKAAGILLYPAIHGKFSEIIELEDHTIVIECLDLTTSWQKVEEQLLDVVARNAIH
jgi:5-methylcytosine-specific restriction enzyme subunit McrC